MNRLNLLLGKINFSISLLYFGGIILVVFLAWGYGDDYFILNRINDKSLGDSMLYFYNNWDGRQLSPAGFIHFFSFKFLSINLGIGLIFVSWVIFLFCALKILAFHFKIRDFVIITTLFLIGLFPFYKDILFWKTGGFYVFFLIQTVAILWFYKSEFIKNRFLEFLIIFLLSLNSINIIFPLFTYFLFLLIKNVFLKEKNEGVRNGQYLIAIFLGILMVSVSPGNSIRLDSEETVFLSIEDAIFNIPFILYKALNYSKYAFILGVLAACFLSYRQNFSKSEILKIGIILFALSLFSIIPFILTPSLARVRVFFSMATILFFSGCFIGYRIKYVLKPILFNFIVLFAIVFSNILLLLQIKLIIPHSKLIAERESYLLDKYDSHEDVIYPKIVKPAGLLIIRSPNYNIEWNTDLVNYYQLKSYKEY